MIYTKYSTKNLLEKADHRQWPFPTKTWQFYQEWNDVIFLHYKVKKEALLAFVPKDLNLDICEGSAWISLVGFTMEKVRPKYLPPFGPISNFYELNIRTYVTSGKKSGVYFLSIEAGKKISCELANLLSGLPYRFSYMDRQHDSFKSWNTLYNDQFLCSYSVGNEIAPKTNLDIWLTERYTLFHDIEQLIFEFDIHHLPWALNEVKIDQLNIEYQRFQHLLNDSPVICHYAKGVQVLTWGRKKVII